MIAIATYSFTKITLAIINLVKARKSTSAKLVTLRNISLASAFVSIFTLQRSMLVSFGNMSEINICIFNGVVGAAVCIPLLIVANNKKKAKKAEEEATINAYKRKRIDTTDDKTIDVYTDEETAAESEVKTEEQKDE